MELKLLKKLMHFLVFVLIALARVFVKKPKFVILDEATSNLVFNTEESIFNTFFNSKLPQCLLLRIGYQL